MQAIRHTICTFHLLESLKKAFFRDNLGNATNTSSHKFFKYKKTGQVFTLEPAT